MGSAPFELGNLVAFAPAVRFIFPLVIQPCVHTAGEHGLLKSPRSLKLRIQHDNLDGLSIEVLGKGSSK
jgi:hypothetical protein